jgi:gamma-glutamyltranspeptidase / glutathione hydrolase
MSNRFSRPQARSRVHALLRLASVLPIGGALLLGACSGLPTRALAPSAVAAPHFVFKADFDIEPAKIKDQAAQKFAVAAANPLATSAAYQVLRAGGSAVDAAIAAQMVLTLVEPQSSGIGGGAFLLHHNGRKVEAFDGRETAPAQSDETLFLKADGKPMAFADAVASGRSVGVPGAVKMLELAHARHGKLPWAELFVPAIYWAENGFAISPRLHTQLLADLNNGAKLRQDPVAAAYFYAADGQPKPAGTWLRNPELANTLRALATQGAHALHRGDIAQAMVDKVRQHPVNPGFLSLNDLDGYAPKVREALCFDYAPAVQWVITSASAAPKARSLRVCGFPPPSSGAVAMGQILGILSHAQQGQTTATLQLAQGLPAPDWLHDYTEAARLAFADRALYLADPDFVPAPAAGWASLLGSNYLQSRARLIGANSMKSAKPGDLNASPFAAMATQPEYGTSHLSIVDSHGNALAMTTTIEDVFGARLMVKGFLLNNELTDFSFAPRDATGKPIANRVEPGKRPRSSMSPTLVFDQTSGELLMSLGSPGGANIIHYSTKTLYGIANWGLTPQQAINLPNFSSLNGPTLLEQNRFPATTVDALKARGHEVQLSPNLVSGLQALVKTPQGWVGGADPRREGVVLGE